MFEKEKRYSFKKGLPRKAISTPYFTLRYGAASGDTGTNAVVVSKKVSKKAVTRNQIKRKILNILRQHLAEKNDTIDLVIYVRPQIIGIEDAQIENVLKESISKI